MLIINKLACCILIFVYLMDVLVDFYLEKVRKK
jgi:hypothetical protein